MHIQEMMGSDRPGYPGDKGGPNKSIGGGRRGKNNRRYRDRYIREGADDEEVMI